MLPVVIIIVLSEQNFGGQIRIVYKTDQMVHSELCVQWSVGVPASVPSSNDDTVCVHHEYSVNAKSVV